METRNTVKKKFLHQWFSICSRHFEDEVNDCEACDTGSWVFMPTFWMGGVIESVFPRLWQWWANRGNAKRRFKSRIVSRRTGKAVDAFPELR